MRRLTDIAAAATDLAYGAQVVGNRFDLLPGFTVDQVFDDQWENTGFYAVSFSNPDSGMVVIGLRGSQDRLDIVTNGNLGISQYLANRAPLIDHIGQNILGGRVLIAGHSLGGGLAQYLAYDAALAYPQCRRHLSVHTHNGFGGVPGIAQLHGAFDRRVLAGVRCRHFRHPGDLVSRIGLHAGPVYDIAPEPDEPSGFVHAHANRRFLRPGPGSAFRGARRVTDTGFALNETLGEIAPDLHKALKAILQNGEPLDGVARLTALLGALPAAERRDIAALALGAIPFHNTVKRWMSQLLPAGRRQEKR